MEKDTMSIKHYHYFIRISDTETQLWVGGVSSRCKPKEMVEKLKTGELKMYRLNQETEYKLLKRISQYEI